MNALHILFRTNRFNVTQTKGHFINGCCFGEDCAAWLREKLAERGAQFTGSGQEDWGWWLQGELVHQLYFLAISGFSEPSGVESKNTGEWTIIVKKNRSISQRISGAGKIQSDDEMVNLIESILRAEPDFTDVRRESDIPNSQ